MQGRGERWGEEERERDSPDQFHATWNPTPSAGAVFMPASPEHLRLQSWEVFCLSPNAAHTGLDLTAPALKLGE